MIAQIDTIENALLARVRSTLMASSSRITKSFDAQAGNALPLSGKMLRSRFGIELFRAGVSDVTEDGLLRACAAVELVHTASLCHDDVIDNALTRRHKPTLWQVTGPSCAVLIGDVLLCEALQFVVECGSGQTVSRLLEKVREVCSAEVEQELCLRARSVAPDVCLRIARGKTGPLFAFIGQWCGGSDRELSLRLEESGYLIGAAYQLADDLVDVVGAEHITGKTVCNDAARQKHTLAQEYQSEPEKLIRQIEMLSQAAVREVSAFPRACSAVEHYIRKDLEPTFNRLTGNIGIQWRLTA